LISIYFPLMIAGEGNYVFTSPNFAQGANIGIQFIITVLDSSGNVMNLTGATGIVFAFLQPDQSVVSKTAALLSNGLDGNLAYATQAGDLPFSGLFSVQAQFSIGTSYFTTQWGQFKVGGNI